jgi:serine/threonine-protein kinase
VITIDGSRVLDVSISGAKTMGGGPAGDAAPPAGTDAVGKLELSAEFSARYRLGRLLGSGAAGMVYEASELSSGRPVAIKFLIRSEDKRSLSRFLREAKCLSGIEHENVVRVMDCSESCGRPYLVTERLEGGSLADRLAAQRMLRPHEGLEIVLACANGLAAVHRAGVVHRDIKPSNILFAASGGPKLADLGIARSASDEEKLTRTGDLVGTPLYMSPEQVRGEPATPASDLYSLGVVFYEMLAGRPPFVAPGTFELMKMHLEQSPPPLEALAPGVPGELAALISTMLAKDPAGRPRGAEAVSAALRQIRSVAGAESTTPASARPRWTDSPVRTTERRRLPVAAGVRAGIPAAVATGVVVVVAMAWAIGGGGKPATDRPPPSATIDAASVEVRASQPPAVESPSLAFDVDVTRTLAAIQKLQDHAARIVLLRALQARHPGRYSFAVANELRHSLGDCPAAAAAEDEIMREEPMQDYILSIMGAWIDPKAEPAKAARALEEAAARYPALVYRSCACLLRASECWLNAGQPAAAIACAKRALALDAEKIRPYRRRAEELLSRIRVAARPPTGP